MDYIIDDDFYLLLELAYQDVPMRLGNVEFWYDGSWCYDIPKSEWDVKEITNDLSLLIKELLK